MVSHLTRPSMNRIFKQPLKFIFPFLFLHYINPVISQKRNLPSDSLSKYSYTIFGQIGKTPMLDMGTCFFLKNQSKLFLITAKHVLYDCDTSSKIERKKFEIATVFLPTNFEFVQFKVPVQNDSCLVYYKDSDLIVFQIDNSWFDKVNAIDSFILPPFKKIGKMTIYGQGMRGDSSYLGFDKQHNIELKAKTFKYYTNCPSPDSNYVDTIHHFIETKELEIGNWMKGFSGSPVFLQDAKSKRWRFCGVFVQALYRISDELPGGLVLVTPRYVIELLNKFYLKN